LEKTTTFLWFKGSQAEQAASFYVELLPDSRINHIQRSPADNPTMKKGEVILVSFTLAGQEYIALNGRNSDDFTDAISFQIATDDQAETDRLWDAFTSDGGEESMCGWCKDRFGVSWQVTPKRLTELMASDEPGVGERVMQSMMTMKKINIAALEAAANAK